MPALGTLNRIKARSHQNPWLPYHENLTESTARLVGALPREVVVMNSLTVNLHLMMVSFYRPTAARYRILIEGSAFPSDQYAAASQVQIHGFDPADAVVELIPREGEDTIRGEDIVAFLEAEGESVALVMLGNCNYLTGQAFDMAGIARAAHKQGCYVGFNLAHGAGNLELKLHDWDVDFAVWCSYKYLNAGPGAIAGCFVHEKHAEQYDWPRFAGWWGHEKSTRFLMGPCFNPIKGAEGWQLSNPPIFQLAALRASMDLFDKAGISALRKKSELLTGYLEYLLENIPDGACRVITPKDPSERGCQLSVRIKGHPKDLVARLKERGAICDFRQPDIMRVAPAPLYNSFADVWRFCSLLGELLDIRSQYSQSATSASVAESSVGFASAAPSVSSAVPVAPTAATVSAERSGEIEGAAQRATSAPPSERQPTGVPVVARPAAAVRANFTDTAPGARGASPDSGSEPVPPAPGDSAASSVGAAVPRVWRAVDATKPPKEQGPSDRAAANQTQSEVQGAASAGASSSSASTFSSSGTGFDQGSPSEKPTPVIRVPQRVLKTKATGDLSRTEGAGEEDSQLEAEDPLADSVLSAESGDTTSDTAGGTQS